MRYTLKDFIDTYNDVEHFPRLKDVAEHLGIAYKTVKNKAGELRRKGEKLVSRASLPLTEKRTTFFEDYTSKDCIISLQKLAKANPEKEISRIFYRNSTGISDSTWDRYFGTFDEFKRQAGLTLTRQQQQFEKNIAKHASRDVYSVIDEERRAYEGRYTRDNPNRFKTLLVASDLHDIECDKFFLRVLIDTAKRAQPDTICIGGDLFDLPEFGKYNVDPREWDVVKRIKFVHQNILKPLREACPNTQIDLVEGNHECVTMDTKVLTDKGWVLAKNLKLDSKVASYSLNGKYLDFSKPVELKAYALTKTYKVRGKFTYEDVSQTHRIDIDGKLQNVRLFSGQTVDMNRKRTCINVDFPDIEMLDEELRFFIKTICLVRRAKEGKTFFFKANTMQEMWRIKRELEYLDLPYTKNRRYFYFNKQTKHWFLKNKSQEESLKFSKLSKRQLDIVLEEFENNGYLRRFDNKFVISVKSKVLATQLQKALVFNGYTATMTKLKSMAILYVYTEIPKREKFRVMEDERKTVVAIQTHYGTLITMKNGIINFTGNCRLIKHLAEATPALRSVLSDLHGFTVSKLLGLDEYEVNYIAKADLKAWSKRDSDKELANNYKVYWDSFLVHHLPQARTMGMPGCHGHHHQHITWSAFSPLYGTYEWHQLGCGHKRVASYCEGEKWGMGFALVNIDTQTKKSLVDYVPVQDFAMSGGKYYYRNPEVEPAY